MISLDDAFDIISRNVSAIQDTEFCLVENALGRIGAVDVVAPYALPPFTNTGVDGYAIRHQEGVTTYNFVGASFAGEPFDKIIEHGQAVRIATGAALPEGADTVVMQEVCGVNEGILKVRDLPSKGSNIRHAGGDIAKGAIALQKGAMLRPQEIALLCALGIQKIEVVRKLRVAVASTGLELRQPGEPSSHGQIVDTNTLMLMQMLSQPGIEVTKLPALPDDLETTRSALDKASQNYDLVITTGGVSVGDRDFVRDVLHEDGNVLFWKIAIRPGKPVIAATIGSCIMIGLPGNPVSAFVTFHLIVRAALQRLRGKEIEMPSGFQVQLSESISKPEHLRSFSRTKYRQGMAIPYPDQSSNLYTSLTDADGVLDLPEGKASFTKGESVIFRPLGTLL
jgi:molybdopterin molybdotransferase